MTEGDAFGGGVAPGGLRTKNDIRILICYILASVGPLAQEDLAAIMQEKGLANYFEITDGLAALQRHGNIIRDDSGGCVITPTGREIADSLDATLPLSVRDKALEAAVKLLSRAKIERENQVEILEEAGCCRVTCHISGGDADLMSITLTVADRRQAQMVKENFHENPGRLYELLLAALTGDAGLAETFFQTPAE